MKKAIILALLLLSLDKEELDDFIELMRLIQNGDERVMQALTNLQRELNKMEG